MSEVDVLDKDESIPGQNFVCVSFLSPEKLLKNKEIFFQKEFLKFNELNRDIKRFNGFLSFIAYKYNHSVDKLLGDFKEYIETEKESLKNESIEDDYKNFLDVNEETLTEVFSKENKFQTNVRGLKIRGCYETQKEAEHRCKTLRQTDPNHDIFVGPVGTWMPWDPEAYKTGKVEYLEKELNTLMKEKNSNELKAKHYFNERVKHDKKKAIEENKKNARKHNYKLSQNIKDDGTLYRTNKNVDPTILDELEKNIERNVIEKTEEHTQELNI